MHSWREETLTSLTHLDGRSYIFTHLPDRSPVPSERLLEDVSLRLQVDGGWSERTLLWTWAWRSVPTFFTTGVPNYNRSFLHL